MHFHTNSFAQDSFCHRGKSQLFIHELAEGVFDLSLQRVICTALNNVNNTSCLFAMASFNWTLSTPRHKLHSPAAFHQTAPSQKAQFTTIATPTQTALHLSTPQPTKYLHKDAPIVNNSPSQRLITKQPSCQHFSFGNVSRPVRNPQNEDEMEIARQQLTSS